MTPVSHSIRLSGENSCGKISCARRYGVWECRRFGLRGAAQKCGSPAAISAGFRRDSEASRSVELVSMKEQANRNGDDGELYQPTERVGEDEDAMQLDERGVGEDEGQGTNQPDGNS